MGPYVYRGPGSCLIIVCCVSVSLRTLRGLPLVCVGLFVLSFGSATSDQNRRPSRTSVEAAGIKWFVAWYRGPCLRRAAGVCRSVVFVCAVAIHVCLVLVWIALVLR